MRAQRVFWSCSVLSTTGRSLRGSCACALARLCVRSASAAAFGAHLAMYRIHSAVKNVIPKIQVPFFLRRERDQSLSEVGPPMLRAATTPKKKTFPNHFNIEWQVSLNDLFFPSMMKPDCLCFVGLGINIFHRGRQNQGICSSVATGDLGNWCAFGSSI